MASNYTTNYELPLWEPQDSFLRTEFNEANQKIDAAIAAHAAALNAYGGTLTEVQASALRTASGGYIGTGTASHTVQVGFAPALFLIARTDGYEHHLIMMGDFAESVDENGGSGRQVSGDMYQVHATAQGVSLSCTFSWDQSRLAASVCNVSGVKYAWFALG